MSEDEKREDEEIRRLTTLYDNESSDEAARRGLFRDAVRILRERWQRMRDEERAQDAERLRVRAQKELRAESPEGRRESAFSNAKAFLRAGGTLSWDRWRSLDDTSRAALVEAGEDVAQDRAILVARALVALSTPAPSAPRPKTHDEILDEAMARAGRSAVERAAGGVS